MASRLVGRYSGTLLLGAFAVCVCRGQEEIAEKTEPSGAYDRARYDVIIERSPFGADPLVDAEETKDAAAAKALEKDYRLCFLLESQSGEVRAGFQNIKAKKGDPKSVMLMVGESYGGMKLVEIDLPNSEATIQYQGRSVKFALSKGNVAAAANQAAATAAPPAQPQRRFGSGFRRTTPPAEQAQPQEPPPPPQPPQPELTPEEIAIQREAVQENLRQYQMEVLRQGMPPLPIALTPEMDDQLVAEGVLPPVE